MTVFVVDTNVAIAANGKQTHADVSCQLACVKKLNSLVSEGQLAVDDKDLIFDEYRRCLNFSGAPGVGDAFFKHIFYNQYRGDRIRRVAVTPSSDCCRGFEELPRNNFDPADRKFLAVAVVASAVVLNATDCDWREHKPLLEDLEVKVQELCPQHVRG